MAMTVRIGRSGSVVGFPVAAARSVRATGPPPRATEAARSTAAPSASRSSCGHDHSSAGHAEVEQWAQVDEIARVLRQGGVEVRAAEAEGADARTRGWPGTVDPRPRLGVDGKTPSSKVALGSALDHVGGSTLWCRASVVLISPAMPAAALVWPIMDLTEPKRTSDCGRA